MVDRPALRMERVQRTMRPGHCDPHAQKIIFNACNGGGPCAPTKQSEECMKRVCDCEKVACKYVTGHTCKAYGDANDNTYSTHGELQDYLQAGNFGTSLFIQNDHKHDSAACDPSTSLRVFHHRERATTGHHCKLKSGAGSDCHCKCNKLQSCFRARTTRTTCMTTPSTRRRRTANRSLSSSSSSSTARTRG